MGDIMSEEKKPIKKYSDVGNIVLKGGYDQGHIVTGNGSMRITEKKKK